MHTAIVFGAAGYSGTELVKLLLAHPHVRLLCAASDARAAESALELTGNSAGSRVSFVTAEDALARAAQVGACDVAFLAVPPEAAKELAPKLMATVKHVIDLSHAYRGDSRAVYGLTPLFANDARGAALVANPGCYATAVITALAPLVRHGVIECDAIAVSAASGVTGAGRSKDEALSLGELYGDVRAYKVLRHQHVPEIEAALARVASAAAGHVGDASSAANAKPRVILTTHLLPIARGIFVTVTARLRNAISTEKIRELFHVEYTQDPFVRIASSAEDVSLRRVVGTNACLVGVASEGERGGACVVTAAIDNLIKGAAGQAIENMNLMLGVPQDAGLSQLSRHG